MVELSHPDNLETVSRELMRNLNTRAITTVLFNRGKKSRAELARQTGLTQATISNITAKLLESRLVEEVGEGQSTGGRKPTLININNNYGYVVGVKIEKNFVLTSLFDLRVNLIDRRETRFDGVPSSEDVVELIEDEVLKYDSNYNVIGIGIGVSGLISDSGEIIYSPILDWKRVPIAEKLESQLSLPATVDNDVNSLTLAESWVGAGKEFSDLLCVTVGEGIGAGLIINDRLYRGSAGGAGEIGHITLDRQGPRCRCGEEGCLEALASDYFLQNEMQRRGLVPSTVENLASLASRRQAEGLEIFREMGHNLGLGIKNLVNTLNPEAVVLGGERMEQSEFFLQEAKEEILNHSFPREAKDLEIVRASLGKEGWLIGAALLSIRNFLGLPLHRRAFESNRESRGVLQTGTQ